MAMNAAIRPKVGILTAKFCEQLPTGFHLASAICLTIIANTVFVPYRFCAQWLEFMRGTFICTADWGCSEKNYFVFERMHV